jgi:hypothetical protein
MRIRNWPPLVYSPPGTSQETKLPGVFSTGDSTKAGLSKIIKMTSRSRIYLGVMTHLCIYHRGLGEESWLPGVFHHQESLPLPPLPSSISLSLPHPFLYPSLCPFLYPSSIPPFVHPFDHPTQRSGLLTEDTVAISECPKNLNFLFYLLLLHLQLDW